jgi:hypothetical protein
MIKAKAFRTYISTYSVFKSERLSTNNKLNLHKALMRNIMTYACPALSLRRQPSTEIAAPAKQNSPHHWKFSKAHTIHDLHMDFKLCVCVYIYKII